MSNERLLEQKENKTNFMKSISLETLSQQVNTEGDIKKLNLIIKTDVTRFIGCVNYIQ